MSTKQRLDRIEAQLQGQEGPVIVWLDDDDTPATALTKTGLTPEEVEGRTIIYVSYERALE